MSDHFLDTDNRDCLARTARICIEAGLTIEQARTVWRYDVSRAVALNLWGVGGEWAGFDESWLIPRIERLRARWDNVPGTGRWIRYWIRSAIGTDRTWQAIARLMRCIEQMSDPVLRSQLAHDLDRLTRVYFGLGASTIPFELPSEAAELHRLSRLYHEHYRTLVAPVLNATEGEATHRRVLWMLGEGPKPTTW